MPTKTPRTPRYCLQRGKGTAYVRLNGQWYGLGKYRSPESRAEYDRLIALWLANGRRLPDESPQTCLTVNEMILGYYRHCEERYGRRRNGGKTLGHIRIALALVKRLYGSTPVYFST